MTAARTTTGRDRSAAGPGGIRDGAPEGARPFYGGSGWADWPHPAPARIAPLRVGRRDVFLVTALPVLDAVARAVPDPRADLFDQVFVVGHEEDRALVL